MRLEQSTRKSAGLGLYESYHEVMGTGEAEFTVIRDGLNGEVSVMRIAGSHVTDWFSLPDRHMATLVEMLQEALATRGEEP